MARKEKGIGCLGTIAIILAVGMVASNLSENNSTTSSDNSSFIKESKTNTIVESS